MTTIETFKLNASANNKVVYAKNGNPMKYTNRKVAARIAEELLSKGINVRLYESAKKCWENLH